MGKVREGARYLRLRCARTLNFPTTLHVLSASVHLGGIGGPPTVLATYTPHNSIQRESQTLGSLQRQGRQEGVTACNEETQTLGYNDTTDSVGDILL